MHDFVVKSETYKYILRLQNQYSVLAYEELPCKGAIDIWKLATRILEKISLRLDKFSNRQIQLINTLLPNLEEFCGFLNDSKLSNVPWSLIPSLESLFSEIRPGAKFVITPKWEVNYGIVTGNIFEYWDVDVLSIRGLLFDDDENFDNNIKELLKDIGSEIYILFYPRSERLSVLQFPILGHEIGHIFAHSWLNTEFDKFINEYKIKEKLLSYVKNTMPKDILGTLFEDHYERSKISDILNIYRAILAETISDIIGAIIFGHTALLSSYIFAIKHGLDNYTGITKGYLPWRYRLNVVHRIIDIMKVEYRIDGFMKFNKWLDEIHQIARDVETDILYKREKGHDYLKYLVDVLNENFETIFTFINKMVPGKHFDEIYDHQFETKVYERLKDEIIPNCVIDDHLVETPIDLRNIVSGTWRYIGELIQDNYENFVKKSNQANLLSLKGIELSYLQSRVKRL